MGTLGLGTVDVYQHAWMIKRTFQSYRLIVSSLRLQTKGEQMYKKIKNTSKLQCVVKNQRYRDRWLTNKATRTTKRTCMFDGIVPEAELKEKARCTSMDVVNERIRLQVEGNTRTEKSLPLIINSQFQEGRTADTLDSGLGFPTELAIVVIVPFAFVLATGIAGGFLLVFTPVAAGGMVAACSFESWYG